MAAHCKAGCNSTDATNDQDYYEDDLANEGLSSRVGYSNFGDSGHDEVKTQIDRPQTQQTVNCRKCSFSGCFYFLNHFTFFILFQYVECGIQPISGREGVSTQIIKGHASQPGKYPWIARVQLHKRGSNMMSSCGGSVINDRYILTAAHCVSHANSPQDFTVILHAFKTSDFQDPKLQHKVKRFIRHPAWNGGENNVSPNDIALLELAEPLKFEGNFNPICIADFKRYSNLFVAGWGLMDQGGKLVDPPTLRETDLKEVPSAQCQRQMRIDPRREICAGDRKATCQGDSGGPLMTRQNGKVYQTGIVSFGIKYCSTRQVAPSVFERPSFHLNWIRQHTQNAQWCKS
jgi:secreted trypsin-like serine protease